MAERKKAAKKGTKKKSENKNRDRLEFTLSTKPSFWLPFSSSSVKTANHFGTNYTKYIYVRVFIANFISTNGFVFEMLELMFLH